MVWNLIYFALGVVATLATLLMGHMLTWLTDTAAVVEWERFRRVRERAISRKKLLNEMYSNSGVRAALPQVHMNRIKTEISIKDDDDNEL